MPRKRSGPERIIGKLGDLEGLVNERETTAEVCHSLNVSEQTLSPLAKVFGDMGTE